MEDGLRASERGDQPAAVFSSISERRMSCAAANQTPIECPRQRRRRRRAESSGRSRKRAAMTTSSGQSSEMSPASKTVDHEEDQYSKRSAMLHRLSCDERLSCPAEEESHRRGQDDRRPRSRVLIPSDSGNTKMPPATATPSTNSIAQRKSLHARKPSDHLTSVSSNANPHPAPIKRLLALATLAVLLLNSFASNTSEVAAALKPQSAPADATPGERLMRSANVELNRRSLQRPQREVVGGASAANLINTESSSAAAVIPGAAPTCGYPGSPAHASVTFNTTHVVAGTAASYTCDNGYELLGPPRRICQANGTWSPVGIPFCVLNVGLGKAAMQSTTAGHGSAQKAVDGSTSPYFQVSTCTMTDAESNPWWYVNLLEPYLVQIVRIDFGTACCGNRQKATIAVRVGNNRPDLGNNPLCNRYHGFIEEGKPLFLPCTRPAPGAFVSIHLEAPSGSSLSICETFIYTDHALSIEQCPSFRDQPLGSTATYNGKCYLFHNNHALNFDGARKYCESRGGTLVDETSPALQGFLSWELYRRHRNDQLMGQYWLGATRDSRNQQNWKWINGKDVQISFWNSPTTSGNCSRFDGSKGWLWSDTDCAANLNFICQYRPLSCGKPEKPTNSTLVTRNVDNGTVIEYQCAPGNLLMGPKSRACLPTGFFSEFAPKCKYLDCQFPAMIPNGDYRLLNGTTSYQSVVTYFCNDGYALYGKSTLTCDVDERWNGPPPRCEQLLCPAPVAPSNGYVTVTSNITTPGTQATYDCRPNYELIGDRLLSCLPSGSWDNSFPYCREKRQLSPHQLQVGTSQLQPSGAASTTPAPTRAAAAGRQQPQSPPTPPRQPPASSVQFQANRSGVSAGQQPVVTSVSPPAVTSAPPTSTTSMPASLNGLAGQFVPNAANQQQQQQGAPSTATSQQQPALQANEIAQPAGASSSQPIDLQRRPTLQTGANQFVTPELAAPNGNAAAAPARVPPSLASAPQLRPQQGSPTNSAAQFAGNRQQASSPSSVQSQPTKFVQSSPGGSSSTTSGGQSPIGYDSSPLATNSISVHSASSAFGPSSPSLNNNNQLFAGSSHGSSSSTTSPSTTPFASTTTAGQHSHFAHHPSQGQLGAANGGLQQQQHPAAGGNVLASFSAPVRPHNALANAKYSLDGIIAVAIFGGFIFLGAIITILVIIVRRRKSSQSSTIDAQTISTYDSNGEHNGLYRNYQQAWENLRFAAPNSQPKSSGNGGGAGGGVSLITAHVSGGPSIGLKNYASPGVAMLHNHHHHHHGLHQAAAANQLHGHHNLAMSSSSSQSSSLGVAGMGSGSGGGDPLLGPHHHHHRASMLHQQQQQQLMSRKHLNEYDDEDDDDDDDDDEQGVISADETGAANPAAAYRSHHHHHHQHRAHHLNAQSTIGSEGFRDSNELTINADTALMAAGNAASASNGQTNGGQATATRRRLYSTNSIGRSMASAAAANRRSMGNSSAAPASGANQQHQRLVSSSTSSTSTHSSRASPPSDDHSLDQLAYGTNWPVHLNQQQQP